MSFKKPKTFKSSLKVEKLSKFQHFFTYLKLFFVFTFNAINGTIISCKVGHLLLFLQLTEQTIKEKKIRKIVRKSQPNFQHYVKEINAQEKRLAYKKRRVLTLKACFACRNQLCQGDSLNMVNKLLNECTKSFTESV